MEHLSKITPEANQNPLEQAQLNLQGIGIERINIAKSVFWKATRKRAVIEFKEDYIVCDQNKDALTRFIAWFSGDIETMNKYGDHPMKGIMLRGNPGSGKSILFRIMKDCLSNEKYRSLFAHRYFTMISCESVSKIFGHNGDGPEYLKFGEKSVSKDQYGERSIFNVCFDDLGDEEAKNKYGNFREVMNDVIKSRYDHFINGTGLITHFTTNCSFKQLIERYDARIESRLRHMCNIIDIGIDDDYTDFRKSN